MGKDRKEELQEFMYRAVPITRDMGITVSSCDPAGVILRAPIQRNLNHEKNAFGGSLNALALMAGWGLLFTILNGMEQKASAVIQESSISYLCPVTRDFEAVCQAPDEAALEKFRKMLARRGKARMVLESKIYQDGKLAVTFRGTYVVESVQD